MNLDQLYERDPVTFIKYNIGDVALCVRLNEKLKHIELHNMLRRDMKTPFSSSMVGVSSLFTSMFNYTLQEKNLGMRWGLLQDSNNSISEQDIQEIERPKEKSIKWNVKKIDERIFRKILSRFVGAYVKEGLGKILTIQDGILVDLDASLPPWEKIYIRRNSEVFWGNIGEYEYVLGDETLTWDNDNVTCWRKVKAKTVHPWKNKLVKITTETGKTVTVTSNHSIFGIKKGIKTNKIDLLHAIDLEVGDYVTGFKYFDPNGIKQSTNPELIGFWLSDGWCTKGKLSKYIAKQDKELLELFVPDISNIRIKKQQSIKYKQEWVGTIIDPIKSELNPFINHTQSKNFLEILKYDLKNRKAIWEGMMFADGTIKGLKSDDVKTPTERLCKYRPMERDECFVIAHTIGWSPRNETNGIANAPIQSNKSQKYGPSLVCPEIFKSVKGACSILSKNNMSPRYRHPIWKIKKLLPHVNKIYTDYMGLEKIKKIEVIEYDGNVYDLSVEETERFFAGTGIGVHNTALYPCSVDCGYIQ
jgi:intein/homing endonuclease